MDPKVDAAFGRMSQWHDECAKLRKIVLACKLSEELKWGQPCYTVEGRNVLIIHGFKEYCALLFFKGALMKDPAGILVQQTKNVQAGRQIRFTSIKEITKLAPLLKAYVKEAAELEKAGAQVTYKKTDEFDVPEEFQKKLDQLPALKRAFKALTPGRQRAYLLHFAAAKQSKTRESRIEKHLPRILEGLGIHD